MTEKQRMYARQLEDELKKRGHNEQIEWTESNASNSRGFLFGEVQGVTVTIAPHGLVNIPAVRSYHPPKYPTPVIAAACAGELWSRQKARDEANVNLARSRRTGHLAPIIGHDLTCASKLCPCHSEDRDDRRRRERGGFNENLDSCA
jgi:hypothetical protein